MTSRIARAIAAVAILASSPLAGCGGDASSSRSPGTVGSGGTGSGGCGTLVNGGPTVQGSRVAEPPPPPTGGSITSGTYFLTSYTVYTGTGGLAGPSNNTHRGAFAFDMASDTVGTVEIVDSQDGGANQYTCGSVSVAGTALTVAVTSPPGMGDLPAHYSANGTEMQFQLELPDGTVLVYVLTKQ